MSSYDDYPHSMRLETRKLMKATEADPSAENAIAISEFIERSPQHEACFKWHLEQADSSSQRTGTVKPFLFGLAAVLIVAVSLYVFLSARPSDFALQAGAESQVSTLDEGSHVVLFPRSSATVHMSSDSRRVDLLSGGLAIKPTHDASRPFELVAGNTRVTALGTQFSVVRRPQDTEVYLSEGRVLVSANGNESIELNEPGELTRVTADGVVAAPVQRSAVRPERPLTPFQSATLSDVAAAFNEHNSTLQIEVKGDRGTHYDFRLQLDNPEEWLSELGTMSDVFRIERRFDVITIVTIIVLG